MTGIFLIISLFYILYNLLYNNESYFNFIFLKMAKKNKTSTCRPMFYEREIYFSAASSAAFASNHCAASADNFADLRALAASQIFSFSFVALPTLSLR